MTALLSIWKGEIERPKTVSEIAHEIARKHGLTVEDLRAYDKRRPVARARQEAMAEMYATGRVSLPWIARYFRRQDHTTVLHAVRQHAKRMGRGA